MPIKTKRRLKESLSTLRKEVEELREYNKNLSYAVDNLVELVYKAFDEGKQPNLTFSKTETFAQLDKIVVDIGGWE